MSKEEPQLESWEEPGSDRKTLRTVWLIAGVAGVLIVALFVYLSFRGGRAATTQNRPEVVREDSPEAVRQTLARETDLATCRSALQQVNSYLADNPAQRAPALTPQQLERLQALLKLDPGERGEIEGSNYTALDANHLERCFLFRDVARSLEMKGLGTGPDGRPTRPAPLDQAAAFAWAVREVRLQDHGDEPLPPAYAARCGWGNPLDRALVYLALLEQVGRGPATPADLLGCLVVHRDKPGGQPTLWACGVVVNGGNDVYLFDPRLGLPLPGRDGKGVATLAEVRKDPGLLTQLNADDKHRYDVTPEQVRTAEILLVCPLSALAPRMRTLQDQVLGAAAQVRLARDVGAELKTLEGAARAGGEKAVPVEVWREGVGLLRRFLPPEDGGVDAGGPGRLPRKTQLLFELMPAAYWPEQFRNKPQFAPENQLGIRVRNLFASPFISSTLEAGRPRDLLLRGRFNQASAALTAEYQQRGNQVATLIGPELEKALDEWGKHAIRAYADLQRAQTASDREAAAKEVENLWKPDQARPLYELLTTAVAEPRGAEVVYLLGLCMHEQAERFQSRLDLQARQTGAKPSAADVKKAQALWQDALSWWREYEARYPKQPAHDHVRRLLGRAEAMGGDWKAAVAAWEQLTETMTTPEKVANLYLVRQLKKEHSAR